MRKNILTTLALFPLFLSPSHAAQSSSWSWPMDAGSSYGYPSEESGTSAYLGVDISDVSPERLSALKLKEEKGVEVTMVDQDAPAGKAGIKEHDVILNMNGTAIESGAQLRRMIHETPAGRVVTFGLSRDGQPLTIQVQLGDKHKEFSYMPGDKDVHVHIPPMPNLPDFDVPQVNVVVTHSSARSGLMVENLTPQLGEFFGVKNGNGVLVRSVEKGSRAEKAGFRAGDVIVKVNDQTVHDSSDFTQALRSRNGSVSVGVIRDKREQNLNLTLPARKDSGEMFDEESFEGPVLDSDSYISLSEVEDEIAKLEPEMRLADEDVSKASQEARKSAQEARRSAQEMHKASEEMRKSLCSHKKQMREQAAKVKQLQPEMQEKLRQEREKLMHEMERLRHEMRGEWLDI
jgi:serine protease Do